MNEKRQPVVLSGEGIDQDQVARLRKALGTDHSLERLLAKLPSVTETPRLLTEFLDRLNKAPDPKEAFVHLDRIISSLDQPAQFFGEILSEETGLRVLFAIIGQSVYLTEILVREPEVFAWLVRRAKLERIKRWPHFREEIEQRIGEISDPHEAAQILRRYRRREVLRIALRDILGFGSISDCALELSNLADNVVYELTRQLMEDFRRRYGAPKTEDDQQSEFITIALGKLGGRELNFSSDIDLIFVYQGEGKPERHDEWDNFQYFERLATELVALISTPTDEGNLYRVDTRLRPEGTKGALVRSLNSLELYYSSWGENWERQAMLKARPIAGSAELGERFLRTIRPFTFRKYVDQLSIHETLQNMSEMRSKSIDNIRSGSDGSTEDVKTGSGGIRDVEFVVQAIQMLYGGQYPEVRCAGTLESLERIRQSGLLSAEDFNTLNSGYRFLRKVEHRLQMEQGRQVYTLPQRHQDRRRFARRLGYSDWPSFFSEYREKTRGIHVIFDDIFSPFSKTDLFTLLMDEQQGDELLRQAHLKNTQRARNILQELQVDPDNPHLKPKIRRLFRHILPRLLEQVGRSPDSELALLSFQRIVNAVGARSSLYATLASNPGFVELLVTLGSQSKYLTDILVRFPDLLDRLGDPEILRQPLSEQSIQRDHSSLSRAMPGADETDILRRLKRVQILKIGMRYLLRLSDVSEMTSALSSLAEYLLQKVLELSQAKFERKYGKAVFENGECCRFSIIGMGKLGGRELGFGSDLDLLFVYESDKGRIVSVKGAQAEIGIKEYFVRLASDVMKTLSHQSVEGSLYQTDVRLRPYGKGGDLASSVDRYRKYYQSEAELWERQALTRADWVAGDRKPASSFLRMVSEFVYGPGLSEEEKGQIAHLRGRIEKERKGQGLKSGEGGLVDVEFLVQAMQLENGNRYSLVHSPNTIAALKELRDSGLIEPRTESMLTHHYLFIRDIENRLQIMDGISITELPSDPEALELLVRRMYHLSSEPTPDSEEFLQRYRSCRKEIRQVYADYFGVERGGEE